jgi:tetratricopeptide (TPR) repeat protein
MSVDFREFCRTSSRVAGALVLILAAYIPTSAARAAEDPCVGSHGDEAIAACTRDIDAAAAPDRQLAPLYLSRGEAYYSRYDIERALVDINQAIRLDPQLAAAYDARGRVHHFQPERALIDFETAIKLDPRFAAAYVDRGAAYRLDGKLDSALGDLDEAIRLDPDNPHAYEVRGAVYRDKGDFGRAIVDYSEAIHHDLQARFAYLARGQAYQSLGQFDAAITDYDHAIALGSFTAAYEARGSAYQAKGNFQAAIRDFDEAVRRNPDDAPALRARGMAKIAAGDNVGGNDDLVRARRLTTIFGLDISTIARLHAALGLMGLLSGAVVLLGLMTANRRPRWTALFFITIGLADAGGLLLRETALETAYPLGLSLGLLVVAAIALYVCGAERRWRWVYVTATIAALYLNVIVATPQAFLSLPFLMRLLPLDPAPVLFAAPLALTALFLCFCIVALHRYRPAVGADRMMEFSQPPGRSGL